MLPSPDATWIGPAGAVAEKIRRAAGNGRIAAMSPPVPLDSGEVRVGVWLTTAPTEHQSEPAGALDVPPVPWGSETA